MSNLKLWHVGLATVVFGVIGYFTSSNLIEIISAVSGLLCVWLAACRNIWNYPIGFINIAAFMIIFYDAKLYADFTLQIVFAVLGGWGWYIWLTKRRGERVRPTTKLFTYEWIAYGGIVVFLTGLWGYILQTYTDASIPYADAFIATLSVFAQFLLSKKVLQNWYIWITVDVLSIIMYTYKGLDIIAILYGFFLINAIYGAVAWTKEYNKLQEILDWRVH